METKSLIIIVWICTQVSQRCQAVFVLVCSMITNRKGHLPNSCFKVDITCFKLKAHIICRKLYKFNSSHKEKKCFYIVQGILFLKLVLDFSLSYFLALWFILVSKIKPKEDEAGCVHEWHLPYSKMLISQRWQIASTALVNMQSNSNIFEVEVKKIQFGGTNETVNSNSIQRQTAS